MPTIDFPIQIALTSGTKTAQVDASLLIGYDESNPGRWRREEATISGINADELGLIEFVDQIEDEHDEAITAACIEAECNRRDASYEHYRDAMARADDMRRAL